MMSNNREKLIITVFVFGKIVQMDSLIIQQVLKEYTDFNFYSRQIKPMQKQETSSQVKITVKQINDEPATQQQNIPNSPTASQKFGEPFLFTVDGLPSVIAKKVAGIVQLLNSDVIDMAKLKQYLSKGIPDEAAIIREYAWKLILGYLPEEKSKWQQTIQKQTKTYQGFVKMFLPPQNFQGYPLILKRDHPRFKELESDYLIWEQIEKDTSRTHGQFSFFATACPEIMIPYLTSARREKFKLINGDDDMSYQQFLKDKEKQRKTYRYDYMTRILYIYSKMNPKILYVQGMNEILAPIFYLVNITKPSNAMEEASCFFMFNNAIVDIIELHIKDFDKSKNGIYGKLHDFNQMLVVIEPTIWSRLEKLKIDPFFYCFRWVTLLYAQDFALFDTLRLWQSIFSNEQRMQFIHFLAIAIIISSRQVIIKKEFTVVMEYLQNIKDQIHVNEVIRIANDLYAEYKDSDFNELAIKSKKNIEKTEKQLQKQKMRQKQKQQKEREQQRQKEQKQLAKKQKKQQQQQQQKDEKGQKKNKGLFSKFTSLFD